MHKHTWGGLRTCDSRVYGPGEFFLWQTLLADCCWGWGMLRHGTRAGWRTGRGETQLSLQVAPGSSGRREGAGCFEAGVWCVVRMMKAGCCSARASRLGVFYNSSPRVAGASRKCSTLLASVQTSMNIQAHLLSTLFTISEHKHSFLRNGLWTVVINSIFLIQSLLHFLLSGF